MKLFRNSSSKDIYIGTYLERKPTSKKSSECGVTTKENKEDERVR